MKTRLEVLSEVLSEPKNNFVTRISTITGKTMSENEQEYIWKDPVTKQEVYYDVLLTEEIDGRVQDLMTELYDEEQIEENYGLNEEGVPELSSVDIEGYLRLVGEKDGYYVYTPMG